MTLRYSNRPLSGKQLFLAFSTLSFGPRMTTLSVFFTFFSFIIIWYFFLYYFFCIFLFLFFCIFLYFYFSLVFVLLLLLLPPLPVVVVICKHTGGIKLGGVISRKHTCLPGLALASLMSTIDLVLFASILNTKKLSMEKV